MISNRPATLCCYIPTSKQLQQKNPSTVTVCCSWSLGCLSCICCLAKNKFQVLSWARRISGGKCLSPRVQQVTLVASQSRTHQSALQLTVVPPVNVAHAQGRDASLCARSLSYPLVSHISITCFSWICTQHTGKEGTQGQVCVWVPHATRLLSHQVSQLLPVNTKSTPLSAWIFLPFLFFICLFIHSIIHSYIHLADAYSQSAPTALQEPGFL